MTLSACDRQRQSLVDEDRMVEILVELHLANARAELFGDLPPATRDSIYQRYNVDSRKIDRTVRFYAEHPERYGALYDRVLNRIMEEEIDAHVDK